VYPNPTRSDLNVQVSESLVGSDMYIFDALGKQIHKQQILSTNTQLSVNNFSNGNYIVRIGEVVKRFVVQK
jgi:phosphoribosylpyrophosphate synthetase